LSPSTREIDVTTARRLAITNQRLAGPRLPPTREGLLDITRALGYLQLDPINVVARSHELVLWSRVGPYDTAELDALLWTERRLFEYWAHAASIVLTEDYPLYAWLMRRYPRAIHSYGRRVKAWLAENLSLRRHVLTELRRRGPLRLRDFEDRSVTGWSSGGWTNDRNVERMLDVLWTQGKIFPIERSASGKYWDLAERVLPEWTPRQGLTDLQLTRRAAPRAIHALGVATPRHITRSFTQGRYPELDRVLRELERNGTLVRVHVAKDHGKPLPGPWYVRADDLPTVDRLEAGDWEPRTTLLSPFDNLIIDRDRTDWLWDFLYRMEIYVPKEKRTFGYYSLPILHGDRLIGRIDSAADRPRQILVVNSVHAEATAPKDRRTATAILRAIEELAAFTGPRGIELPRELPAGWRGGLRS
jgi:uncharacterized protein YcaQ